MDGADSLSGPGSDRLTFPRSRHLKRKRLIEPLFDRSDPSSNSVRVGCVRIAYRFVPTSTFDEAYQVGVAVGRSRGHAPRRNRVKRMMREAIRHNQIDLERLAARRGERLTAMFLFQGRDEGSDTILRDTVQVIRKLERSGMATDGI